MNKKKPKKEKNITAERLFAISGGNKKYCRKVWNKYPETVIRRALCEQPAAKNPRELDRKLNQL